MKIASAQINSTVGEIQQNLKGHYQTIKIAIEEKVQLIAFPEMSITGYCRDEGEVFAFTKDDSRLKKLQELSYSGDIIIIVGAPIKIDKNLFIGSFIIFPDKPIKIYTKQYLHDGEELFYSSSMEYNPYIDVETERISLAICADINNENHPFIASQNDSTIYIPSIFYSENGIETGYQQLKKYAKKYSLNILMSNYSGELWGMKSGGKSAFWNSRGELLESFKSDDSGILIAERTRDEWKTKIRVTI